jgi:hypothetical protein
VVCERACSKTHARVEHETRKGQPAVQCDSRLLQSTYRAPAQRQTQAEWVHASTKTMAYHCVVTGVSVSSVQREFYRVFAGGAARRPRTGNLSVGGVNVSAPRCANLRQCDATIADLAIGRACVVTSPKFALFDFFGDNTYKSMKATRTRAEGNAPPRKRYRYRLPRPGYRARAPLGQGPDEAPQSTPRTCATRPTPRPAQGPDAPHK